MEKDTVYYWDIHDKKLTEKRKKDLRFWYVMMILFLIPVTFLNLPNLVYSSQKSMESFIVAILIWIATCVVVISLLRNLFAIPQKASINNGIKLTSDTLKIYKYEYPLSSVLHSEVVDFAGSGGVSGIFNTNLNRWLALFIENKGKIKVKLIRADETEDILKLSNLIRKLKGIPEQKEIKTYGNYRGYYKWKRETLEKINLE